MGLTPSDGDGVTWIGVDSGSAIKLGVQEINTRIIRMAHSVRIFSLFTRYPETLNLFMNYCFVTFHFFRRRILTGIL